MIIDDPYVTFCGRCGQPMRECAGHQDGLSIHDALETIRDALCFVAQPGYDWNADPLGLTLKQSDALRLIDELRQSVRPDNPKPQTFEAAMRAYEGACLALNRALRALGEATL